MQAIFVGLTTKGGTNRNVSATLADGDVIVWYFGDLKDYEIKIEREDILAHIADNDLNEEVHDEYDAREYNGHKQSVIVLDPDDYLEENLDRAVISYIRNNTKFQIL